jgi:hypothetical protein
MQASRAWLSRPHDAVMRRPEEQIMVNVTKHCRNAASWAAHAARAARTASHVATHSLSDGAPAHATDCSAAHARVQTSPLLQAGVCETSHAPKASANMDGNAERFTGRLSAEGEDRRKRSSKRDGDR